MTKSLIHRLYKQKKIDCPDWLPDNLCYLTLMGSRAYGTHNKDSDWDYVGWCMVPKNNVFPQDFGLLIGLDKIPKFDQFKREHFIDQDSGKDMEITIYGLIRFVELLAGGNPNIIESLFTRRENVVFSSVLGEKLRDNRKIFLSKQTFIQTRNYAFSQLKKLNRVPIGDRVERYEKYGYDTKFAAHCIRLLDNSEQILKGNLDLHNNKEMIKNILLGEMSLEEIKAYSHQKEILLEEAYHKSTLPDHPPIEKIRNLTMELIEYWYQDVNFVQPDKERLALEEIQEILNKVR